MSIFERPILFYSDYCNHSNNFIKQLLTQKELFDHFIRINIDVDVSTNQRPKIFFDIQKQLNYSIQEVPTIIVNNAEYILSGEEAFKWLEFNLKTNKEVSAPVELSAFNPNEMGSFSDSYSPIGSSDLNDAREQSFKFIDKPDQIIDTPQENSSGLSSEDYTKKQQERENFDNIHQNNKYQQMQFQQQHKPQFQPPLIPQYNHQNVGGGNKKKGQASSKQKEMDTRLQQLLLERQMR